MKEATPFWTDERIEELKARWRNGETMSEIARGVGAISRNAVISKVHRLGLRRFKLIKANGTARPQPRRRRLQYVDARYTVIEETVTEDPPPQFQNPVRFFELKAQHCRWPGAGTMPELTFCGAAIVKGYPYCLAHCRLAYVKPGATPRAPGR